MYCKTYYTYILTNKNNRVLYTGITNNIQRRLYEHKFKRNKNSFSCRYRTNKLVYFEEFDDVVEAINREKEIKGWLRQKKINLVDGTNPDWDDLAEDWVI